MHKIRRDLRTGPAIRNENSSVELPGPWQQANSLRDPEVSGVREGGRSFSLRNKNV
jgi:hypothetical protein